MTNETRQKMSESHIKYNASPAGIAKRQRLSKERKGMKFTEEHKKKLSEAKKGSNNLTWQPFILKAHLPNGEVEEYVFDGDTPYMDCVRKFGINRFMVKLKSGGNAIIKRKGKRYDWPMNTVLQMKLIKTKKNKTNKK